MNVVENRNISRGHRLGRNLISTFYLIKNKQKEYFGGFQITFQQYSILQILKENTSNTYSTADIRDRMLDKMSDVSRIIDRLLAKGLVKRSVNKSDKRLVDIEISREGIELLKPIEASLENRIQNLFKNLSDKEQKNLENLLNKIGS